MIVTLLLPDGDGLELLAERRAAGEATLTVLLTAREEPQLLERAARARANACLPQPLAYDEFLSVVASWTSGHQH